MNRFITLMGSTTDNGKSVQMQMEVIIFPIWILINI